MRQIYEKISVTVVPLNESIETDPIEVSRSFLVLEVLEMIGSLELRDQLFMICNLLTISGFKQKEIAEQLGVAHQTYRNRLLEIRKEFRDNKKKEM